ncbi:response regulator [Nonomuraea sp. SYSU D8015]|uniref:response regulator n=1 Tax=Nonomuraea sp. SYSU D8015 TaxID=2593644 RepID=UPI0016611B29|nr:response regulator transcription factor [Nonomuraea sp. SYSU D8015]
MLRVLVVDDQVLIRAGLAALIRAAPDLDVVGEAASGEEAVELASRTRPDVILMDIRMPGMDGIAATERILAAAGPNKPKVLILTTFDLDEYVYKALRVGASGFLLKETTPQRLLSAIHTVAGGDTLLAPAATRHLVEAFCHTREPVPGRDGPAQVPDSLTGREAEVLVLVGRAMSNKEIADHLTVSESTVKTHLNRAMAKLGLSSRAQAVAFAYEHGLITPGEAAG